MTYRVETRLKCLKCGFGIFFGNKEESVDCPKCRSKYTINKDEDEVFLELV